MMTNERFSNKELFKLLDELAMLNQEDLEDRFCKENNEAIRILVNKLLNDNISLNLITPSRFAGLVYELRNIKKIWSRKLGNAIIMASELADKGEVESAVDILEKFKDDCPSSFYRENAQKQIEYLRS